MAFDQFATKQFYENSHGLDITDVMEVHDAEDSRGLPQVVACGSSNNPPLRIW